MTRSMMLVINPHSGRGLSKTALGTIVSRLCDADYIVTVFISHDQTPEELAFEYAKQFDLVVCVGGDGTLSGVISGMLRAKTETPVGYIPTGTANDVATTLTLSRDPASAALKILNGTPKPLDIGRFHDRYFTYIAAFGAFTGVSYQTTQSAKRALGHFAYVLGGLAEMPTIKPRYMTIEYDDSVIKGDFIFGGVINSTSVAGFIKLNPEYVDLADGKFEVVLVKQPIGLPDFLDIMSGLTVGTYDGDNFQVLHASRVKFIFEEEVAWAVDGESGGMHKEVEITNCHKAIEIVM